MFLYLGMTVLHKSKEYIYITRNPFDDHMVHIIDKKIYRKGMPSMEMLSNSLYVDKNTLSHAGNQSYVGLLCKEV